VLSWQKDGGYWMYGVNPGGVAGGGESREAAFNDLKQAYLSGLFDVALEATTFEAFRGEVERFFNEKIARLLSNEHRLARK
jgi:predicted RNase H-like HicB family nuclease